MSRTKVQRDRDREDLLHAIDELGHRAHWQMRVLRLPKHAVPPADVHVIWLAWYPRGRRT